MRIIVYLVLIILIISCNGYNIKYEHAGVQISFMDYREIGEYKNQNKNNIALFFPIIKDKKICDKVCNVKKDNLKCLSCECSKLMDYDKLKKNIKLRDYDVNKVKNTNNVEYKFIEIYRNVVQENDSVSFAVLVQYSRRMDSKYLGIVEYWFEANRSPDKYFIKNIHFYDTQTGGYIKSFSLN